jgi:hypothetical protein
MAKEKTFKELKEKLGEALDALDVNNPNSERRKEVEEMRNVIGKHISLATTKMRHDEFVKSGGRSISFFEDEE